MARKSSTPRTAFGPIQSREGAMSTGGIRWNPVSDLGTSPRRPARSASHGHFAQYLTWRRKAAALLKVDAPHLVVRFCVRNSVRINAVR